MGILLERTGFGTGFGARFGEVAQRLGYLTDDQIARALELQRAEDGSRRPHRSVGRICLDLGYLSLDDVLTILEHQGMMVSGVH